MEKWRCGHRHNSKQGLPCKSGICRNLSKFERKSGRKNTSEFSWNFSRKSKFEKIRQIISENYTQNQTCCYEVCSFGIVLIGNSARNAAKWAIGRQKIRRYGRERGILNPQNGPNSEFTRTALSKLVRCSQRAIGYTLSFNTSPFWIEYHHFRIRFWNQHGFTIGVFAHVVASAIIQAQWQ
jgi:hypothetical protein